MTHGIYVDWGPARLIARSKEIPVVGWGESYLQGHYFFGHNVDKTSMDMFNMSSGAWKYCKNAPLNLDQLQSLENYLKMRYKDNLSLDLRILSEYSENTKKFRDTYHITKNKPTWAVFSHIFWDNAADFSPLAYVSFEEWMLDTIRTMEKIPDVNWLIKVHPAEIWWGDKDHGVQKLIEKNFPSLPENIKIIPPDEKINPFNFYSVIDGGITSCGTVGLELSILGKPVILAGLPHYSGKGFTYDGTTPDIYRQYLRNAQTMHHLDDEQHLLAQKYGYCYFIRKQIPIPITCDKNPKTWVGTIHFDKRKSLVPHHDPFIDFICEKILDESDFIMDDNLVALAEQLEKLS
jgi:hypothetical protein